MTAGPRIGIDFGTSHTVALLAWPDGRVRPLLFDGSPLLPSAVFAQPDGKLIVGRDAMHAARVDPSSFEASPKRRIDDGSVLLGDREFPVSTLIAAVLGRVEEEATRVGGAPPSAMTLTHPASWGVSRRLALIEGTKAAGLPEPALMPEPVAAAHYFAGVLGRQLAQDQGLLVYDFGGGTFDASMVVRTGHSFDVRAVDGIDDLGGIDLDQLIVDYAKEQVPDEGLWQRLTNPQSTEDRRHLRLLWDDARMAKEMLSRSETAGLHLPIVAADVTVPRLAFEQRARPLLEQTIRTTSAVLRWSGVDKGRLAGVFLVGGSSRIPLVATLLERELGIAPTVIEQPELVVGEGSLRTGAVPSNLPPSPANTPQIPRNQAQNPPPNAAAFPQSAPPNAPQSAPPHAAPIPQAHLQQAHLQQAPTSQAPVHQTPVPQAHMQQAPAPQAHLQQPNVAPVSAAPISAAPISPSPLHQTPTTEETIQIRPAPVSPPAPIRTSAPPVIQPPPPPPPNRTVPVWPASATPQPAPLPPQPVTYPPVHDRQPPRQRNFVVPFLAALLVLTVLFAGYIVYQNQAKRNNTGGPGTDTSSPVTTGDKKKLPPYQRANQPEWLPSGWTGLERRTADKLWLTQSESEGGKCDATAKLRVQTAGNPLTACQLKSPLSNTDFADVAVEVQVTLVSGCGGVWARTGAKGYVLMICKDRAELHLLVDHPPGEASRKAEVAFDAPVTGQVVVALLVQGTAITGYIAGQPMLTFQNDEIKRGRVNAGAMADNTNPADVTFEDFRVFTPPAQQNNNDNPQPNPTRSRSATPSTSPSWKPPSSAPASPRPTST
jgi:hypothetical protein